MTSSQIRPSKRCPRSSRKARRTTAIGLSDLAELYGSGDGSALMEAIRRLGNQLAIEREPDSMSSPPPPTAQAGQAPPKPVPPSPPAPSWSTLMPQASGTESSAWIPAVRQPKEKGE